MIFALLFALARMASAAWVGAAVLFVLVAVDQTLYIQSSTEFSVENPQTAGLPAATGTAASSGVAPVSEDTRTRLISQFATRRFPYYYCAGAGLIGVAWCSALFLKRRYLKFSRWAIVMVCLSGAAATMGYDWLKVYQPLAAKNLQLLDNPQIAADGEFETLHRHSELVNGVQLLLTLFASLCLCLPGTRPEQPTILVSQR